MHRKNQLMVDLWVIIVAFLMCKSSSIFGGVGLVGRERTDLCSVWPGFSFLEGKWLCRFVCVTDYPQPSQSFRIARHSSSLLLLFILQGVFRHCYQCLRSLNITDWSISYNRLVDSYPQIITDWSTNYNRLVDSL